jgi:hypothetical protein
VADFAEIELEDGTTVLFQTAESTFVENHGGAQVEKMTVSLHRVGAIASAAGQVCKDFRDNLKPDELEMEIGVGLSGEVGWFFAKSELDASIKVKLLWRAGSTD